MNDFTIIGTGIVGLATAYHLRLRQPDASIAMIDKESAPAFHQSSRNSGVIHSGIYYTPGSLKAINCVRGYSLMLDFCREHDIAFEICGKIIVGTKAEELPNLQRIFENGIQNGLTGLKWLDGDGIREREPNISGLKAILVPQAGIIDFGVVARKLKDLLESSGVNFQFGCPVVGLREEKDEVVIETASGEVKTRQLITCGGLYADKLAQMAGQKVSCQIVPFRGEYYEFKVDKRHLINHLVYPVPDPEFPFLGVHFTRTINGNVEAGPNAVLAFAREGYTLGKVNVKELVETLGFRGFQKLAMKHMKMGIAEMKRSINKRSFIRELQNMMPGLNADDMIRSAAGVRAQSVNPDGTLVNDFYFESTSRILHVINAPSPAATSSLSIGQYITDQLFS